MLVTAVLSPPILVTPMMKAIHSSKMSVLTRATQRNIPEDSVLHEQIYSISLVICNFGLPYRGITEELNTPKNVL
jgi:hypothetical protein